MRVRLVRLLELSPGREDGARRPRGTRGLRSESKRAGHGAGRKGVQGHSPCTIEFWFCA